MSFVKGSDIRVGPHVLVAYATYYKSPAARDRILEQAVQIELALPHFRKLLNLPYNLTVRIAGVKSAVVKGRYHDSEKLIIISHKLIGIKNWIQTLAHELVHAEQYNTGRLKDELIPSGRGHMWASMWEGSIVSSRGATYAAYRALPWEMEAFSRQEELAAAVLKAMGIK